MKRERFGCRWEALVNNEEKKEFININRTDIPDALGVESGLCFDSHAHCVDHGLKKDPYHAILRRVRVKNSGRGCDS